MYIIFFLLWIIFNGRITAEIVIFGLVIAAAVYWFVCRFMDFGPEKDLAYAKKLGLLIQYFGVLAKEIALANFATLRLVCSSSREIEPVLVQFDTDFKSDTSKFLMANSITLTPGTITVSVEDNRFTVHCLDKSFAEGIESSVFVKLLRKMEG
ncbi:MAG: Na+/H+ antiporter subunit E [Lachnospiraceae bacterium]|nr:Na+/H+ antiporter subunit E [Lachnospiraceae bacterium]